MINAGRFSLLPRFHVTHFEELRILGGCSCRGTPVDVSPRDVIVFEGGGVEIRTQAVTALRKRHCTYLGEAADAHVPVLRAVSLHRSVCVARVNALNILGRKRGIAHVHSLLESRPG